MATTLPQLVIFDCDGVLVDSEPISNGVLARLLNEEGLAISSEEATREFKGMLMRDVVDKAQAMLGRPVPDDFTARFEAVRAKEFEAHLQPVAGARAAVEAVREAGIAACVASQGKLEKTNMTLTLCGLRDLFADDELFSAYSVARGKPHPDLFLHAAETMGAAPDDCLVVEDTTLGVRAALSAAMPVLWYFDGRTPLDGLAHVPRLESLDELAPRLGLSTTPGGFASPTP